MPNNKDFTTLENIRQIECNPLNWINPIFIEYGISYENFPSYCWRVKGTNHTFVIAISRLDYVSNGNYKQHFEEFLEDFREDYLKWSKENFIYPWQQEYYKQFHNLIIL
jgi:hypothetical protein